MGTLLIWGFSLGWLRVSCSQCLSGALCSTMQVPPDAIETMIRQLVNQFVHDRARPEVSVVLT